MKREMNGSGIPGLMPPEVLIFLRIPKTGGNTMDSVFMHCFPDQHFYANIGDTDSALLMRSSTKIGDKLRSLPIEKQRAIRCLIGNHVAMDVDTIFDRPTKFFTVVRHPVDRSISHFFHIRTQVQLTSYPFIKDMSLEQYLDSGIGLDAHNLQVRMLSGCLELDAPSDPQGRPIVAPPVERRHLELAKRNIEERFITAAPLEEFTALVWFFKRLYGWPLRRVFYRIRMKTQVRPKLQEVSQATRDRLEEWNQYDIELYEWVKARFAEQIRPLEPDFSREVRQFEKMNRLVQRADQLLPPQLKSIAKLLMK